MTSAPDIWALLDERAGHRHQVLGLCEALNRPYKTIDLSFNAFASLPAIGPIKCSLLSINNQQDVTAPWPKLIIAAGRRTIPVMRYIKRHSPSTKLVQLMWPGSIEPFDLIVAPMHDNPPEHPNVITTLGALHHLTKEKLSDAAQQWEPEFSALPKPWTGLCLGGTSKHGTLTTDDIDHILQHFKESRLLITTSRRTPHDVIDYLKKALEGASHFLYDYRENTDNPYLGILALSDHIIITGDSISMVSEACYTGKPVCVYDPSHLLGKKHRVFLSQLYQEGYATPIDKKASLGQSRQLNERAKVAKRLASLLD